MKYIAAKTDIDIQDTIEKKIKSKTAPDFCVVIISK